MVLDFSTLGLLNPSACIGFIIGVVGGGHGGGKPWKLGSLEVTLKEHLVFELKSVSNGISLGKPNRRQTVGRQVSVVV